MQIGRKRRTYGPRYNQESLFKCSSCSEGAKSIRCGVCLLFSSLDSTISHIPPSPSMLMKGRAVTPCCIPWAHCPGKHSKESLEGMMGITPPSNQGFGDPCNAMCPWYSLRGLHEIIQYGTQGIRDDVYRIVSSYVLGEFSRVVGNIS